MAGDRAQAHTLEGFVAALLILSGIVFALQATAVTPLTASTSNQHIENQQRAAAQDVLAAAASNGTLRPAVLFWNNSTAAFRNTSEQGVYANGGPPNAFGDALNETFGPRRIAFNVFVSYRTVNGSNARVRMVYQGAPSDNAVSASRTVPIFDDTTLEGSSQNVSDPNAEFYAPDVDPDGPLYNVLEVRIVVWRI